MICIKNPFLGNFGVRRILLLSKLLCYRYINFCDRGHIGSVPREAKLPCASDGIKS